MASTICEYWQRSVSRWVGGPSSEEAVPRGASRRARRKIIKVRMPQSPTSGEAKSAGDSTADNRGGAKGPTADLNEASSIGFVESPDDKKLNAGLDKSRQGGAGETDAAVAVKIKKSSFFGIFRRPVSGPDDVVLVPAGQTCVICMEAFKANEVLQVLLCQHLYHERCIDRWLGEHASCCVCKADLEEMARAARKPCRSRSLRGRSETRSERSESTLEWESGYGSDQGRSMLSSASAPAGLSDRIPPDSCLLGRNGHTISVRSTHFRRSRLATSSASPSPVGAGLLSGLGSAPNTRSPVMNGRSPILNSRSPALSARSRGRGRLNSRSPSLNLKSPGMGSLPPTLRLSQTSTFPLDWNLRTRGHGNGLSSRSSSSCNSDSSSIGSVSNSDDEDGCYESDNGRRRPQFRRFDSERTPRASFPSSASDESGDSGRLPGFLHSSRGLRSPTPSRVRQRVSHPRSHGGTPRNTGMHNLCTPFPAPPRVHQGLSDRGLTSTTTPRSGRVHEDPPHKDAHAVRSPLRTRTTGAPRRAWGSASASIRRAPGLWESRENVETGRRRSHNDAHRDGLHGEGAPGTPGSKGLWGSPQAPRTGADAKKTSDGILWPRRDEPGQRRSLESQISIGEVRSVASTKKPADNRLPVGKLNGWAGKKSDEPWLEGFDTSPVSERDSDNMTCSTQWSEMESQFSGDSANSWAAADEFSGSDGPPRRRRASTHNSMRPRTDAQDDVKVKVTALVEQTVAGAQKQSEKLQAGDESESRRAIRRAHLEGLRARSMSAPIIWDDQPQHKVEND